ncbi:MAG TPA: DUF6776 family protein [Burkholderiaceae bacterium]|nr:DUF6776 family protein [Burkholderiaceae bacterium]
MPAASLTERLWRSARRRWIRRGWAATPRHTVRPHLPLALRLSLLATALLVSAAAAAILTWQAVVGNPANERRQLLETLAQLRAELDAVAAERDRLSHIALAADSRVTVERSASEQLAGQLRLLEAENARLKADIAFFETVLPADGSGSGVSIRRFMVEPDAAPNRLRYRVLVMESGRGDREFSGQMQLVLHGSAGGKPVSVTLPEEGDAGLKEQLQLAFKRYSRVEGSFSVPAGIVVKSVQLRVLERGAVRAQQTVAL